MRFLDFRKSEFYPVTLTMEPELLIFGAHTLKDRWQRYLQRFPDMKGKWVEPTVLPNEKLAETIASLAEGQMLVYQNLVLGLHPGLQKEMSENSDSMDKWKERSSKVEFEGDIDYLESLQDMIQRNSAQIVNDFNYDLPRGRGARDVPITRARIRPEAAPKGIIIDDDQGPVLVGKGVKLMPGARIMGPVAIFSGAVVKMGAEIYPGTSIGNNAVVNGEIKNAIIHAYTSKGHAGYLGDSVIGRWNNFGSGTTVSNVANTYSEVRYQKWNSDEEITCPSLKRGLVTGDFVRLGIMSKIFRGTAIGSFTSISTHEVIQGNIPTLTWWSGDKRNPYRPELLREHCQRQMSHREQSWDPYWENELQQLPGANRKKDNMRQK